MERSHRSNHRGRRYRKPREEDDFKSEIDSLPRVKSIRFGDCIGSGHFSHVYEGVYHKTKKVAVKIIERGSERIIDTEVDILSHLRGAPHIIQLLEVIEADHTLLVFELLSGIDSDDIFNHLTVKRIRYLLRSVLEALDAAHSLGIVHRDVKMGNILVAPHFTDVKLIDWGCGTYISNEMTPKAGSRQCRPPEMLLGYQNYGTGCDVWAVGILILYILSNGVIPWKSRTSATSLIKLSYYFGGNEIDDLAERLNLSIDPDIDDEFVDEAERTLESNFCQGLSYLQDPDLIDLMKTLMTFDYKKRPSAHEALGHRFFNNNNY